MPKSTTIAVVKPEQGEEKVELEAETPKPATSEKQARSRKPKEARPPKPPPRGRWKPGQSGNPNGRPKTGEALSEVVRTAVDPNALIKRMQYLADHAENEHVRFQATAWLSERGWGKAPQEVIIRKPNAYAKKVKGLSMTQLEALAMMDEPVDELDTPEPTADGPGVN